VSSSYLLLVAATVFSLASVPLALRYLSKERFALWALMSSISGYLGLIDLGMSSSVARLLIDHKDDRETCAYGRLIQTGWLVLVVQGLILFVVCACTAPWLASLLQIPPELRSDFIGLMRWQGITLAAAFGTRIFGHVLYAHQRLDLPNYFQCAGFGLNLAALWWFFHAGYGVFSLVWAAMLFTASNAFAFWVICWRLHLFPAPGRWGRPSWKPFRELFAFGKDLFLLSLGGQLILASQTMIITRFLGLTAAALWAVGTKAYNLVLQLTWKTTDASMPGFAEMFARGEETKLVDRYRTIVMLSASFAAFCAVSYALCNSAFVSLWTAGKFTWPTLNDVLLGACLVSVTISHCHASLVGITKQIRFLRYIYFIEGAVFVAAAVLSARQGQLYTIVLCSLVCGIVFTYNYGIYRAVHFFRVSRREVAWDWLLPMRRFLLRAVPVAMLMWWLTRLLPALPRFAIHAFESGTLGLFFLAKYGTPAAFQDELVRRVPAPLAKVLRRVFALPPTGELKAGVGNET
jgi:O-antigen/teichoic acid export membrane protein